MAPRHPTTAGGAVPSRGDGAPLLLVHGFTSSAGAWDPVIPALAERHRVLAVTMDGHRGGRRLGPGVVPDAEAYADGVERDMDAAGIERAHVVGNSLGGWVALLLAARGRAISVVCLAPAGGWRPGSAFERRLFAKFAVGYVAFVVVARSGRLLWRPRARRFVLGGLVARPEALPGRVAVEMVCDAAGCPAFLPAVVALERQRLRDLGPITDHVRIAWSAEDRILPRGHARARFAEVVPVAEQLELPGVGHLPMWDDPGLVARTILEVTDPDRG